MAITPSTMLEIGIDAPPFNLLDTEGNMVSLNDNPDAKGYLIIFMCNHCPYVKHVRNELVQLGKDYQDKGIFMVGISSNDVGTHPEDSPEMMKEEVVTYGYTFPYVYDETQEVAKAYKAACTPDFFLFTSEKKLVYRGQLDDSRPKNDIPVSGKDIRSALDAVLAGTEVSDDQKPSIGCNIKWKSGNEPEYFG